MTALRTPLVLLGALAVLAGCDASGPDTSSASRASVVSEAKVYNTDRHTVYQFETDGNADLQFEIRPFPGQYEDFEVASLYSGPDDQYDLIRYYHNWNEELDAYTIRASQGHQGSIDATVTLYRGASLNSLEYVDHGLVTLRSRRSVVNPAPMVHLTAPGKSYHTSSDGTTYVDYDPSSGVNVAATLVTDSQGAARPTLTPHGNITYVGISPHERESVPAGLIRIHVGRRASVTFY